MKKYLISATAAIMTASAAAMMSMSAFAEDAVQTTEASKSSGSAAGSLLSLIVPLGIMFALLYFIAIKPQKKRDRELKEMQQSLQVGDEIVTGGGIVGIIVRTGEDTVVIETGGERHKLRIKTWAITQNVTADERIKEARAAAASKKADGTGLASAKLVDDDADEETKKSKADDEEVSDENNSPKPLKKKKK
ncbi:MAG: preprotein translocase subunit YajC [Ruminococcus sp.]|nr:preprotein translocase subunit YajC [Ruminococcus sp.]